jgi:hypothetical protein
MSIDEKYVSRTEAWIAAAAFLEETNQTEYSTKGVLETYDGWERIRNVVVPGWSADIEIRTAVIDCCRATVDQWHLQRSRNEGLRKRVAENAGEMYSILNEIVAASVSLKDTREKVMSARNLLAKIQEGK